MIDQVNTFEFLAPSMISCSLFRLQKYAVLNMRLQPANIAS